MEESERSARSSPLVEGRSLGEDRAKVQYAATAFLAFPNARLAPSLTPTPYKFESRQWAPEKLSLVQPATVVRGQPGQPPQRIPDMGS
jgi:hypothetical protein